MNMNINKLDSLKNPFLDILSSEVFEFWDEYVSFPIY
jgi:hypothetical protein